MKKITQQPKKKQKTKHNFQNKFNLLDLSYELLVEIFQYLTPEDLFKVAVVNKGFNELTLEPATWKFHLGDSIQPLENKKVVMLNNKKIGTVKTAFFSIGEEAKNVAKKLSIFFKKSLFEDPNDFLTIFLQVLNSSHLPILTILKELVKEINPNTFNHKNCQYHQALTLLDCFAATKNRPAIEFLASNLFYLKGIKACNSLSEEEAVMQAKLVYSIHRNFLEKNKTFLQQVKKAAENQLISIPERSDIVQQCNIMLTLLDFSEKNMDLNLYINKSQSIILSIKLIYNWKKQVIELGRSKMSTEISNKNMMP